MFGESDPWKRPFPLALEPILRAEPRLPYFLLSTALWSHLAQFVFSMEEKSMNRPIPFTFSVLAGLLLMALSSFAQTPVAPVANPCPRFAAGSVVHNPPALFSQNGVLNVQFSYQTVTDSVGRQLFCFMTPDGLENPTLYLKAGDTLDITVTNNTPFNDVGDFY